MLTTVYLLFINLSRMFIKNFITTEKTSTKCSRIFVVVYSNLHATHKDTKLNRRLQK